MTDQLSAKDWLDQGLKTLAESGFTALKAEPLAKAMGVSRGSFYWHFADIGAFHAAILKHWRDVAAEQIIANLEAASGTTTRCRAAAPDVRQQAGAGERGPHLGDASIPRPARRCRPSTGAGWTMSKACSGRSGCRPTWPAPGANSLLGVSRLCAVGSAAAAGRTGGGARRTARGSPRDSAARLPVSDRIC